MKTKPKLPSRHPIFAGVIFLLGSPSLLAGDYSQQELEEVVVVSQKQPYRGDTPLESLPQAIQVLSGDSLAEMGVVEFQGALDFASGVARQNNFGGLWDSFAVRGFAGDENVPSGYLINGFNAGRGFSGLRDISNIDRIEVMKGPGSALYGRSEPGGTINLVTKKPQFETDGYVQVSAGRYDSYRLEGDYTGALTDSIAFRVNGAYDEAQGYRNTEPQKYALNPSLLFNLSDGTSLSYELELVEQEALFDRGIVAIDGDPDVLPVSRFLGDPQNGPMEIEATGHQVVLQHQLDSGWLLLAGPGYRESSFEGYSADAELSAGRQLLLEDGRTLTRQRRYRDYDAEDLSGRVELTGSFDTGGFTHHLLVGVDAYEFELGTVQHRWRVGFASMDPTYSIDIFDPVYGGEQPVPTPQVDKFEEQSAQGVYVQDQIDLGEQWKMLLGVRYDDFDQQITNRLAGTRSSESQTATSPRAGLVYEATPNLSLYASYAEGFRPNTGSDFSGEAFDPEESKSYEAGIKMSTEDGRLAGTLAVFRAEKSNVLTADLVNGGSAALGEAESRGVEFDLSGEVAENLRLQFTYAYVDAETGRDVTDRDWIVDIPAGSRLINIPEHSGSLSLARDFEIGGAPAMLGLGVNYVGERLGETIDPDYILPEYTLVNLFASYSPVGKLKFFANIDNLLNERYYSSSYHKWWTMPGAPLTYTLGMRYSL
ncbi:MULTISPECIES: TonB-dependent siderophore receptor [unclassified Microbulbifer]|uniref:TonB-dependent siderophore receptor n=1 Tax=unclassified Microbulbifer TaxID=2619833 RepID=UPI0027E59992|nr:MULTISPECIES: TonB-dependent siderophore receptor [unclassified Microbulbifer]